VSPPSPASRKKPSPYYIERALEDLGAETAISSATTRSDVLAADNAGIDSAFVRRPHRRSTELSCQPTYEIDDLHDLVEHLRTDAGRHRREKSEPGRGARSSSRSVFASVGPERPACPSVRRPRNDGNRRPGRSRPHSLGATATSTPPGSTATRRSSVTGARRGACRERRGPGRGHGRHEAVGRRPRRRRRGSDRPRGSADLLGVETLDLLYVHRPRGAYDPVETLPRSTGSSTRRSCARSASPTSRSTSSTARSTPSTRRSRPTRRSYTPVLPAGTSGARPRARVHGRLLAVGGRSSERIDAVVEVAEARRDARGGRDRVGDRERTGRDDPEGVERGSPPARTWRPPRSS